jgi:hypothetical protein
MKNTVVWDVTPLCVVSTIQHGVISQEGVFIKFSVFDLHPGS